MINEVIVFTGSKNDFNRLLHERIDKENDEVVSFMELIQHYNARIHPTESGVKEIFLKNKIGANCLVCKGDDFGSVLEHTLLNFTNIISLICLVMYFSCIVFGFLVVSAVSCYTNSLTN